jgi:uncharacterized protein YndB with AHSA1/START domain
MPRRRTWSVRHQYYIDASTNRVFEALTDPGQLVRWLCDRAEMTRSRGGTYRLEWNGGPTHTGKLAGFVPGKSLTLGWRWDGVALTSTRLKLSVARRGRGTLLTVEHSGFPRAERWVALYGGTEWGWTYFLMNLKSVLETGHDLRSPLDG